MAILPLRFTCVKSPSLLRRTPAGRRREHHVEPLPRRLVDGQRHDRGDALAFLKGKHVDERLPRGVRRRERQPPHLLLVGLAARGEEQDGRVRVCDEEAGDEILVPRLHAGPALAAPPLRPVGRKRDALDVAGMGHGHDHVLALDQVLVLDIRVPVENPGLPGVANGIARGAELVLDDPHDALARAQDLEIV
jgi:hypothetical protein